MLGYERDSIGKRVIGKLTIEPTAPIFETVKLMS